MFRRLFSLLLLGLSLGACAREAPAPARNVVLITMDTTRADRLGCYGCDQVDTPNIDGVAGRGTVFSRAFATAPITGPSHASILSGTYPPYHQVRDNAVSSVPSEVPWLADILKARGYRTAGFVAAYPVKGVFGFARGFDYFSDILEAPPGSVVITNLHSVGVASRKGEMVSREFALWLENNSAEPFFVWLHYYDPHWPWDAGAGYADIYPDDPYNAEIAYMDDCIGTALDALDGAGLTDSTAVVLVADHGEGLMDHGELTHALLAYNTTLRVPLVFSFPWLEQAPEVATPVSIVDVLPTILDALDMRAGTLDLPIQGLSLRPLLEGDRAEAGEGRRSLYFETFYPYFHYGWGVLTGVVDGRWKYIRGPDDELYDLDADLDEVDMVDDPDLKKEMSSRLTALSTQLKQGRPTSRTVELDRQALEMLRSLGYLGGVERASADELPDLEGLPIPRESMAAYFMHNQVLGLMRSGKYQDAARLCRQITEENPTHKDARLLLVNLHGLLGNQEHVGRLLDEVLEDFRDSDVLFQAGLFALSAGDHAEAKARFEEVVARDPGDFEALTALGMVYAEIGNVQAARDHFEAALALDPKHRDALLRLGALLDRHGISGGGDCFEQAIQQYPFDPEARFNYGIFLLRSGEPERALEHLKRASSLADGALFEPAHLALASYYQQVGDLGAARRYVREVMLKTRDPKTLQRAQAWLEALEGNGS